MKTVAIIPVFGRLPLLKHTIERLLNKNGVDVVICIGASKEEKTVSENTGAKFYVHENMPLGKKWNFGFQMAKKENPDVCLFVGSSDWLSDNWLPELLPLMSEYDMIGKPDFTMIDIAKQMRAVYWGGYIGERKDESIGIGRLISARILDKMNWLPFLDNKNNSMDYFMFNNVKRFGGKYALIKDQNLVSLSISTNRWENKHRFEEHWNNQIAGINKRISAVKICKMFPECKKIFS